MPQVYTTICVRCKFTLWSLREWWIAVGRSFLHPESCWSIQSDLRSNFCNLCGVLRLQPWGKGVWWICHRTLIPCIQKVGAANQISCVFFIMMGIVKHSNLHLVNPLSRRPGGEASVRLYDGYIFASGTADYTRVKTAYKCSSSSTSQCLHAYQLESLPPTLLPQYRHQHQLW